MNIRSIPRTVILLGVASFFTDFSSEMIYPLLPLFLTGVLGAGAVTIGAIEGMAESMSSLLKVVSGYWTDRRRRRKPLVVAGYGLAGLVRPLIGLATSWSGVFALRFLDRVGKGLRTSPRDALIADVTPASLRGTAFGVHRSMDHAGAVVGPLVAAALLTIPAIGLRQVFLLAAIPAAVVMLVLVFGVREPASPAAAVAPPPEWKRLWHDTGRPFHMLLGALLIFTLGNSTDAFLLLRLKHVGVDTRGIAVLWALHHAVKVVLTALGGHLADRVGQRRMIVAGWLVYAAVYLAFALVDSAAGTIGIFLVYGVYYGLTEPAEKAWVADLVPAPLRGTAFGGYHAVIGLGALPASLLFGFLWDRFGAPVALATGAGLALLAAAVLLFIPARRNP